MANIISLVFAMIAMIMLLFFGMGAVTGLVNDANITAGDANYNNFQTAQNTTTAVFSVGSIMPYFFVLAMLCGGMLILLSVTKRR